MTPIDVRRSQPRQKTAVQNETQVRGVHTEDRHMQAVRESVLWNAEVILQGAGVTPPPERPPA